VSPEDDQYEIEFPDEDYYPEPADSDLYAIEDNYEYMEDLGWLEDYEPYDWSDVILEDAE
jgi:hypothetical protein